MKHKTWFRLVLKAIGVLMIASSIPMIGQSMAAVFYYFDFSGVTGSFNYVIGSLFGVLGSLAQFVIGLCLFFGGQWIVNMVIPSNRPYCPECGYDLSNNTSDRCPECGVVLPRATVPPPQR